MDIEPRFHSRLSDQTVRIIVMSVTLTAALAINDLIKTLFDRYYPINGSGWKPRLLYVFILFGIAILLTAWLTSDARYTVTGERKDKVPDPPEFSY